MFLSSQQQPDGPTLEHLLAINADLCIKVSVHKNEVSEIALLYLKVSLFVPFLASLHNY